jgi:hypothetical protein
VFGLVLVTLAKAADPPAPPGCVAAIPPSIVEGYLDDAEQRLTQLDDQGFVSAVAAAQTALPCLAAPLSITSAARWHRVMGVRAFYAGDNDAARDELRASLVSDPEAALPESYAAEGGRLLSFYRQVIAAPLRSGEPVDVPADAELFVDGAPAHELPTDRAALIQLRGLDGALLASHEHRPGEDAPDLRAWQAAARVDKASQSSGAIGAIQPPAPRTRPLGLAIATGASALLATGTWAGSWYLHSRFTDQTGDPVPVDDLSALRRQTNTLTVLAPSLGTVALALGVVTVWQW